MQDAVWAKVSRGRVWGGLMQAELQRQGEGRTKANGCRMLAGPRRAKWDEPWRVEASTVTVEHRAIFPSGFCADCHESIEEFSII